MWAQDTGQGAQLCLTNPVGQLMLAHPSSGQGSGGGQGRKGKKFFAPVPFYQSFLFNDV